MSGPRIQNVEALIQAGIDPKTGLPMKMKDTLGAPLKDIVRRQLRIVDEQNAINRYIWRNLPNGLDSRLMERILYYKGQGMFFYMEETDQFYFLPYALDGSIDVYGRFTSVTPLPFTGTSTAAAEGKDKEEKPWIIGMSRKPLYDIKLDFVKPEDFTKHCVLVKDYSEQISKTIQPRQLLNDGILDLMSECFPLMRTALYNSCGVSGMRINDENDYANVIAANMAIDKAAMNGQRYVPIVSALDFQELGGGELAKCEEFLLAMQSLDNYRLSLLGLDNGGIFQKKAHMLQSEYDRNGGVSSLVLSDGLKNRQDAADIINSLFGLDIDVDICEDVLGIDRNMDGESSEDYQEEDAQVTDTVEMGAEEDYVE